MIHGPAYALANRDDARAQNARAEELASRGLLATVDLETTRTRLKVAEAAYQAAIEGVRSLGASLEDRRAAYELAQKKLSDASIKAPVSGSVSERLVQPGEFIKEDTPVITLVQMNPLKLITAVQEKYAGAIHPGMPVQFSVEPFPGEVFHGEIVSISPSVDQQTRTFPIEAELPNPDYRLKPGFFAKGVILTHIDDKRSEAVPRGRRVDAGRRCITVTIDRTRHDPAAAGHARRAPRQPGGNCRRTEGR